jgi:hypothetical protein
MQRSRGRVASLLLAALLAAPLTVAPISATAPSASATAIPSAYRVDLAGGNDFVAQKNFVQCVGASMQMMLNIMDVHDDRSARTQVRLQNLARALSGPTREGFQRKGASVRGWSDGLNQLGAGPYRLVGTDTIEEALRLAAKSIRTTGKPVGLLVWAGRHAWVMSGFEATADPQTSDDFAVTKAVVLDPLYPYGSTKWGRSPRPREAVTPATLGKQFVPRRRGTWAGAPTGIAGASLAGLAGKYVIVMAYVPVLAVRRASVAF